MKKVYGYARVSTMKQNIDRQIRNIKAENPAAVIITDKFTGTKLDRPGWNKLYSRAAAGDVIIFDEVSRMARNAEEGFQVYRELYERGVELQFLKEPHINTSVYRAAAAGSVPMTGTIADPVLEGVNKMLLILAEQQIRIAFEQAQAEVDHLHQRTREGIETARLNGKQIGRAAGSKVETKKAKEAKAIIRTHAKAFGGSLKDEEVMKLAGVSRGTYFRYKKELTEE